MTDSGALLSDTIMKNFILLLFLALNANASDYVLWYDKPADNTKTMNEALVIGNGRTGGQILGNPGKYYLLI